MEEQQKHLIIEITPELHSAIKTRAAFLRTTIKKYVLSAIDDRLKQDDKLNK